LADAALVDLAAALVAIDSVNPDLIDGAAGEREAAAFTARWLERAGLDVEVVESHAGRPSVIGRTRAGRRTLLLNGHLDTVGTIGMEHPLEPRVEGGRMYGRGAYDMKGAVAAAMLAAADAAREGLGVVVTAVADEEVGSIGTTQVLERVHADGAIVCEPTELRLGAAHRGFAGFTIETRGRAAHGSRPDLGIDAIAKMGRVLVELEELDRRVQDGPRHPLLGPGSLHASLIEGGQEYSSYPERCVLRGERRTLPGETAQRVEEELRGLLGGVDGEMRIVLAREPFEVSEQEPVVEAVRRHAGNPGVIGVPFWADSALLAAAGIPTVVFGPGGEGAHAVVEWVELADVERCVQIYAGVAAELCS
jgi:acetylornithine deacetylase